MPTECTRCGLLESTVAAIGKVCISPGIENDEDIPLHTFEEENMTDTQHVAYCDGNHISGKYLCTQERSWRTFIGSKESWEEKVRKAALRELTPQDWVNLVGHIRTALLNELEERVKNRIDEKHFNVCPGCDLCEHRMGKNDAYRDVTEVITSFRESK